jgi:hypothetical protein
MPNVIALKNRLHLLDLMLFLMLFSGPPSFRGRDLAASLRNELDMASMIQASAWLFGFFWIAWNVLRRKIRLHKLGSPQKLGILLAILLGLSAFFSPAPPLTIFRSLQVFIAVVFAYMFVSKYGWEKTIRVLFGGFVLLLAGLYVAFLSEPEMVIRGNEYSRLRGDWVAPAAPVALCAFVFVWINVLKMPFVSRFVIGSLASFMLLLARDRTGYITLVVLIAVSIVTAGKRWSPFWKLIIICGMVVIAITYALDWQEVIAWLIRNPNQIRTLSARLPLWGYLIDRVMEDSPILGLGYCAASRILGPLAVSGLGNAHSSFVEVLVGGGVAAMGIYVAIWTGLWLRSMNTIWRWDQHDFTMINVLLIVFFFALKTSHGINVSVVSFTFWTVLAAWYQKQFARKSLVISGNANGSQVNRNGYAAPPSIIPENGQAGAGTRPILAN